MRMCVCLCECVHVLACVCGLGLYSPGLWDDGVCAASVRHSWHKHTHPHKHTHTASAACPLKRVWICLQMDAYWAPGSCGEKGKCYTGLVQHTHNSKTQANASTLWSWLAVSADMRLSGKWLCAINSAVCWVSDQCFNSTLLFKVPSSPSPNNPSLLQTLADFFPLSSMSHESDLLWVIQWAVYIRVSLNFWSECVAKLEQRNRMQQQLRTNREKKKSPRNIASAHMQLQNTKSVKAYCCSLRDSERGVWCDSSQKVHCLRGNNLPFQRSQCFPTKKHFPFFFFISPIFSLVLSFCLFFSFSTYTKCPSHTKLYMEDRGCRYPIEDIFKPNTVVLQFSLYWEQKRPKPVLAWQCPCAQSKPHGVQRLNIAMTSTPLNTFGMNWSTYCVPALHMTSLKFLFLIG